ncbi:MAG: hypothetical protein P8Y82_11580, partial [Methyloceanibacter sp.]
MSRKVTDEVEIGREARVGQHAPDIAAHGKHPVLLDQVMVVEDEHLRLFGNAAAIDDSLPVVLASGLEVIELEQPVGRREEARIAQLLAHFGIIDFDRTAADEARIEEARLLRHRQEVVPVERPAETLAVEQRVGTHLIRQTPV